MSQNQFLRHQAAERLADDVGTVRSSHGMEPLRRVVRHVGGGVRGGIAIRLADVAIVEGHRAISRGKVPHRHAEGPMVASQPAQKNERFAVAEILVKQVPSVAEDEGHRATLEWGNIKRKRFTKRSRGGGDFFEANSALPPGPFVKRYVSSIAEKQALRSSRRSRDRRLRKNFVAKDRFRI